MKLINLKNDENKKLIKSIFEKYNIYIDIEYNTIGYISENKESAMIYNKHPTYNKNDLILAEFSIVATEENINIFYKRMLRLIYRQKMDIVSITVNNENYNFFKIHNYKLLRSTNSMKNQYKKI